MDHSLNQYADQILNAVYAGLKGPANFPISRAQIKDEIAQQRNLSLDKIIRSGSQELESFRQTIPKLPVVLKDFTAAIGVAMLRKELWAQIPEFPNFPGVKPIAWATALDMGTQMKIVYGNDIFYIKFDRFSGKLPTIWITDRSLWLLFPKIPTIQFITVRTLVENPRALNGVGGIKFTDDDPYPMPVALGAEIRTKMINDYITQYRRGTMQPTLMAGDINISPPNQ